VYVISLISLDMICRNGGLIGAITNGGFAEHVQIPNSDIDDPKRLRIRDEYFSYELFVFRMYVT
jgi:D-arabinose 1-dehydrogenase-like Zn-dependent alcohol dehydrogenase